MQEKPLPPLGPGIPEQSKEAYRVNLKISNRLQRIARVIERELEKAGVSRDEAQFSLLVWGPDRVQYVSTAEREDVKKAMREVLDRWDTPGADLGKVQPLLGGMSDG